MTDCITLAHGSGGRDYRELVEAIFAPAFQNEFLSPLTDAAILPAGERVAPDDGRLCGQSRSFRAGISAGSPSAERSTTSRCPARFRAT